MLLFNNDGNITGAVIKRISIHLMLLFNAFIPVMLLVITYFNTSNVTIQLHSSLCFPHLLQYFNTSNVTIQLTIILPKKSHALYFNTSNVTIQLSRMFFSSAFPRISIHLMLLFNNLAPEGDYDTIIFQYI